METEAPLFDSNSESNHLIEKRQQILHSRRNRAEFLSQLNDFSLKFDQDSSEVAIAADNRRFNPSHVGQSFKSTGVLPSNFSDDETELRTTTQMKGDDDVPAVTADQAKDEPSMPSNPDTHENYSQEINISTGSSEQCQEETPPLSMPSRIGSKYKQTQGKQKVEDDDDNFEDALGDINKSSIAHFLTKEERNALSAEQRASWRALQQDMTSKRKDFHGAVTYAFDGIFSWEMYGSAEAVDEMGKEYTEYLMRCQWGTDWNNLQPWIAARRYREFDRLDYELRKKFPEHSSFMPKLPEKDFFRFLESDVISKRRRTLQDYFSIIVSTMPTLLRSEAMDQFLGISERITNIKKTAGIDSSALSAQVKSVADNGRSNTVDSKAFQQTFACEFMTSDAAEDFMRVHNIDPLDDDGLGLLEEEIREMFICLSECSVKDIIDGVKFRRLLFSSTSKWPQLRATCHNISVDVSLVPRSMQAEEDLQLCLAQYNNLLLAQKLNGKET